MNTPYSILSRCNNPLEHPDFTVLLQNIYTTEQLAWKRAEDVPLKMLLQYWIVYAHNKPVARACVYQNKSLSVDAQRILCIGNFECVNDESVCRLLLSTIEAYAQQEGYSTLLGPMNGSTFYQYRFPLTSIDQPFFSEDYYPDYYAEFWKNCGFGIASEYISGISDLALSSENEQQIKHFEDADFTFRKIDLFNFENELKALYSLVGNSFSQNKFYTPISEEDFLEKYLPYKKFVDPDFFLIVAHQNKMVSIMFCLPDLFAANEKSLIIKTIIVHPDFKRFGMMQELGLRIYATARAQQYTKIIHAYMQLQNGSVHLSSKFGGTPFRTYALFEKHIG